MVKCLGCQADLTPGARFCAECGRQVLATSGQTPGQAAATGPAPGAWGPSGVAEPPPDPPARTDPDPTQPLSAHTTLGQAPDATGSRTYRRAARPRFDPGATPTTIPQGIGALVQSRPAMLAFGLGAGLIVLGYLLGGLFFAVSSSYANGNADALYRSYLWLETGGLAVIVVGVAVVTWSAFLDERWFDVGELAAALVGTLLIAVGALVLATSQLQSGGSVIQAIGIGLWALILGYRAGRSSFAERRLAAGIPRNAQLWALATAAVLVLAIGEGLLSAQTASTTQFVVAYAFLTAGFAALVICLSTARSRRILYAPEFSNVAGGLCLLTLAQLISAIAYAVLFGPNSTITDARVGLAIPLFLALAASATLGAAALQRAMALPPRPGPEAI